MRTRTSPGGILHIACSPAVLCASALILVVAYFILHLAGWRESTTVLSGTLPAGTSGWPEATRQAFLYVGAYLGAVVLAPILALGGFVQWLNERVMRART